MYVHWYYYFTYCDGGQAIVLPEDRLRDLLAVPTFEYNIASRRRGSSLPDSQREW